MNEGHVHDRKGSVYDSTIFIFIFFHFIVSPLLDTGYPKGPVTLSRIGEKNSHELEILYDYCRFVYGFFTSLQGSWLVFPGLRIF